MSDSRAHVMTVCGPIDPADVGLALPHEHLFLDTYSFPGGRNVSGVRGMILPELDASRIENELRAFKDAGGSTVVDLTLTEIGRDPLALVDVSRSTGVHVVMGCGWYRDSFYPDYIDNESIESLAERLTSEITDGVGATGVRPGIIGEIGIEGETPNQREEKVIKAVALAQTMTGLTVTTHTPIRRSAREVLSVLTANGVDPAACIMGHLDSFPEWTHLLGLLEEGAFVQFDCIGWIISSPADMPVTSPELARLVARIIGEGYLDRILLSQDISSRALLKDFGGGGFTALIDVFFEELRKVGIGDTEIAVMTVENPARALAVG